MLEIKWSDQDEHGYERVTGEAFGYPMRIEVYPRGDTFEWRLEMLNQALTPRVSATREEARVSALRSAGEWLLVQAVHERHIGSRSGGADASGPKRTGWPTRPGWWWVRSLSEHAIDGWLPVHVYSVADRLGFDDSGTGAWTPIDSYMWNGPVRKL